MDKPDKNTVISDLLERAYLGTMSKEDMSDVIGAIILLREEGEQ